jgi:hypothetical protein
MKKALIILSLVLFISKVYPQNPIKNCTNSATVSSTVSNFGIFNYPEKTYVGMVYNSVKEVKNLYPEELMSSILCANNQQWVDYNEINPPKLTQEKIDKINSNLKPQGVDLNNLTREQFAELKGVDISQVDKNLTKEDMVNSLLINGSNNPEIQKILDSGNQAESDTYHGNYKLL